MLGNLALVYSTEPSVIVISNDSFSSSRASAAVTAAGGRVIATVPLADAVLRLESQRAPDMLMLELCEDSGAALDRALDQIDHVATREGASLLVSITPDLIDLVSARIRAPNATILCSPTSAERAAAIAVAWGTNQARVNDRSQDFDAMRLQHLADEVGRIAKTLASFGDSQHLGGASNTLSDAMLSYKFEASPNGAAEVNAAEIRTMIKLRRLRERHFDSELFADPAWDMMLDLMAARVEHARVSVSSLCIAAAVPATTALRWIKTLTDQGTFLRVADPTDGRRVFIELSDGAAANLVKYFTAMKKTGGLAV